MTQFDKNTMLKTAIVILNWNGADMLRKYLPSVIRNKRDGEAVFVGDNGSTDGSVQLLRRDFPSVDVICMDKNYGFAEGYNKTLKKIEAEYYILLNSDVEVTPNWTVPLTRFMDANSQVAACQPKLLDANDHSRFEYAGACGGFIDRYGYPFCRGRIFSTIEKDNHQYDTPAEIMWATGACLMIRAQDYWSCNGLDGRFFAHLEEIDLCWRLCLMGKKVYCVPQSYVYHVGGATLKRSDPMKTYLNFRNDLTMLYKNLPESELRKVLRLRYWLDRLAALQAIFLGGGMPDAKAIFRARADFKRWKHDFDNDRKAIARIKTTSIAPQHKRYSILWQYYVLRRTRFSQLP